MPNSSTTIFDEMLAAARGLLAIISGDRKAPSWFDFSQRGLAGSFIAFLVATAIDAYLPSANSGGGYALLPPSRLLTTTVFLFVLQLGFSAVVLRQIKRLDVFVPYVVADNWAAFFLTIGTTLLSLLGIAGDAVLVVLILLGFVIEINIARLIMTLTVGQIVILLVARVVGLLVGLLVIGMLLPMPLDTLAQ